MLRFLVLLLPAIVFASDAPSSDTIREAAERGLAAIQQSQKNWNQNCTSCHHQFLPALAVKAAREHGLKYDQGVARANADRITAFYDDLDRAIQYTHIIDPAMDDAYRLVIADVVGVPAGRVTSLYAEHIAEYQYADGHWDTQDVRPPQSSSPFTATALAMHAIQLYSHPEMAGHTTMRIAQAAKWLRTHKARNTEERVFQLKGLDWAGFSADVRERFATELLGTQQRDGGWSSLDGRQSEVYSTAEVLVALADDGGVEVADPGWQRGLEYLLRTQQKDGTWHVSSRLHPPASVSPPYFETGYPYGHDQFISAMGACYAVMALARALGSPRADTDGTSPGIQFSSGSDDTWIDTVLFGTVADLHDLLESSHFDPNSATAAGTTALMMAMPNYEKASLLIDRGANVNAVSKTRFTALLVASSHPGSERVVKLLLDKGAKVAPAQGAGRPLFNATPLNMAAFAHDDKVVKALLRAGEPPNEKMLFLGLGPSSPPFTAVLFNDPETLDALLNGGVGVDTKDDDGTTLLHWAAIGDELEVAHLLIARKANVNAVDSKGMTPLLYSASIDFGSPNMVNMLLKAGADPKVKTKEGLTALDLARKYNHTSLIPALEKAK